MNKGKINVYTIVTWNGASFDFDILAEESGLHDECAQLALNHVDLMAIVVAMKGHYLGLAKAAEGAGVASKLKEVTLNDGSHTGMDGAQAPRLWAAGEHEAVMAYLQQDVETTLAVAKHWHKTREVVWVSNRGYDQILCIYDDWNGRLPTVKELLTWEDRPDIDTSWMTDPLSLSGLVAWTGWENAAAKDEAS